MIRSRAWICVVAGVAFACAGDPEVQTVLRPDAQAREPKSRDCPLVVYPIDQRLDPSCREIGDVWVGDSDRTTECSWNQIVDTIRRYACFNGADAAQIVSHYEPSFWGSTCHQARARLVVCHAEDARAQ